MYIALTSLSSDPAIRQLLPSLAEALEVQLYQHYSHFWQSSGMHVKAVADPNQIPSDASPLVVFDNADQPGALGWHSVTPEGLGYGRAFWKVIQSSGGTLHSGPNSLSVTLSHEALEMVGNPYVNMWADVVDDETQEAVELCDRVEADSYPIRVSSGLDIHVSNFLGPRAFRPGPGPYDWMRLLTHPFEIRPGGYAIRRKGNKVTNVWGHAYPEVRKMLKRVDGSRTMKRLAAIQAAHHEGELE
jgi:hypothetical protein